MSGRRIRGLRWWIIGLVMAGTALNYLTRSVLGVAAPTMMADTGITDRSNMAGSPAPSRPASCASRSPAISSI